MNIKTNELTKNTYIASAVTGAVAGTTAVLTAAASPIWAVPLAGVAAASVLGSGCKKLFGRMRG